MARVFKIGTGQDFGWDDTKSLMENERVIWRMHEWWLTNRSKLIFNPVTNRFEPKEEKLPGEVGRDK